MLTRLLRVPTTLANDLAASRRSPVLVVGLPRSGSSWLANVLATGESVRYYREPYNSSWHPEAVPFHFRYLRADDRDAAFDGYTARAFSGGVPPDLVDRHAWGRYDRFRWWPGQVLVKEVHALLAVERIERLIGAKVVVITRHPASMAASWRRLGETRDVFREWQHIGFQLEALLGQPQLLRDHLAPHADALEATLRDGTDFQKCGAIWGAVHHVFVRQAGARGWTIVTHELLCTGTERAFRGLFDRVGLRWTERTSTYLHDSTSADSGKPFDTRRVPEAEVNKWRSELTSEEAREVCEAAAAFGTGLYDFLDTAPLDG